MALLQNRLCTFYRRTVRLLFALAAAWLFVSCLVTTNYVSFDTTHIETSWICPDTAWLQCALFSLACFIPILISQKSVLPFSDSQKRVFHRLRLVLIGFAGFLALFWTICVQLIPNMDAGSVQSAAADFSNGIWYPHGYMYIYPHQSGLFLLHLLLQNINPDTTLPFQLLNVLCYTATIYLLGELALELELASSGCLTATIVGIAFLPLLFTVPYVYGTIPGLCFAMASLVLTIRYCHNSRWYNAVGAAAFLFLSVMVKSNYQIFAIGTMLYVFYNCLRGNRSCWVLLILLVLSWFSALKLPILIVERMTGTPLRNGFASISWVGMGLRADSYHGPGWYDGYTDVTYVAANNDSTAQSAIVLEDLKDTFRGYVKNPKSMVSFFARKNATEWSEPLFQSVWLNISMHESLPDWTFSFLKNQGLTFFSWTMNLFQTLIYGGLILWAWVPTNEKRNPSEDLLAVILLGGFVFHTFWEAKNRYTLPYVVLILPLALLGYRRLAALPKDPEAKALWQPLSGKIRFLMPGLLMALALVLSVVLAAPLNATLTAFLQAVA